ncbi:Rpn family recombination-promoting nuclease/putative transposase [Candidatus Tisiphia endosymbiont of Nedyus quadrimaculatus]|uniref:Rpn family recombination-promoting nuclease/putative transposase n=1 Tax=Candidatus Tisiphia endosymbiont of Nedyus quadrimaculatus TaxID=3139332 RepID=UPI00345ECB3A
MDKITPRVDLAFKKIFGVEENKDLLISLINSIVGQEDQVTEVTLLNPYNPKNFKNDKLSILDVKAKSVDGKRFNIEIQISDEADYDKRALYYWAKLYTEQLKVAQDYSTLSKAIGIHILNFTSIPNVTKYHNVFHIVEKDSGLLYFKDLELHTIELNKFTDNSYEELPDILKKVKNSLDMWTAFLTRHDLLNKDNLPKELDNASLKKALTVLDVMNFTDEEREAYEDHLKWLRIEANTLKKQLEKGRVEGKAEGREEGRYEERITIARKLLKENMTSEHIANITGLSIEEINKLLK